MALVLARNHVVDGRVWLPGRSGPVVDLPSATTFSYGKVVRALSALGERFADPLFQSYLTNEDDYSLLGHSLTSMIPGVQVVRETMKDPGTSYQSAVGNRIMAALQSYGVRYVEIQTITIPATPPGYLWRVVALRSAFVDNLQSITNVVTQTLGATINTSSQGIEGLIVNIPASSSTTVPSFVSTIA